MDQLSDIIFKTVYIGETYFCVYLIVIKGTQIAILEYHSYVSLLDQYNKL